jgi:hypothetical protein
MEKTLTIDGREVRFKSNGSLPLRYKAQFGRDLFKDILKMASLEELSNKKKIDVKTLEVLDFDVFYNVAWIMAKVADPTIGDPITWLDGFDSFPMATIIPELQELLSSNFIQAKKKL